MLKRYSQFFKSLMLVNDLMFLTLSWWLAYFLRFYVNLPFLPETRVFRHYAIAWILILMVYGIVFQLLHVYRPRRISTHWRETVELFKGAGLAMLIFLGVIFVSGFLARRCLILVICLCERGCVSCAGGGKTSVTSLSLVLRSKRGDWFISSTGTVTLDCLLSACICWDTMIPSQNPSAFRSLEIKRSSSAWFVPARSIRCL
jgi:hypothetical protein